MAQKFILLSVLWLVVAIFATSTRATTAAVPGNQTTATVPGSQTTVTVPANQTTATVPGNQTAATVSGNQTTATVPGSQTTVTVSGNQTTATVPGSQTTVTVSGNQTTATVPGSQTTVTVPGNQTTVTVPGSQTTATVPGNQTTATVPGNQTTVTVPGSQTAATVQGNQTTATVPGNQTTATVQGSQTTATVPGNQTAATVPGSQTAATVPGNQTTVTAPGNQTAGTASGTSTPPFKDPCNPNPCGTGSTCEARFDESFVCLCLPGDFYSNDSNSCERSKVFPGKLKLKKAFNEKMRDRKSKEFKETADKVIAELYKVYKGTNGYSGSIVLELRRSTTPVSRNAENVDALVQISYEASSKITEDQVVKELKDNTCAECTLIEKTFETTDLCATNACDKETTQCTSGDGTYECACKDGYRKTGYTDRMCTTCPIGEKLKDNNCVKCSFGYSGFNCSENWKLILVIVGSVLGGLLLIALILLPVVATQKSNKSFKKNKTAEMEKPSINLSSAAQPMASNKFGHSQGVSLTGSANGHSGFQNGGVPMFPRAASPINSWDNRTNLEMKPSNGGQNIGHMNSGSQIYDEQDDIRPYAQTRPQNNPYAQNQPRMNPYTQNQGHSNPHYTHDDGRRYY
ncbi:mucin-13b isoform X1 [Oreochromis niloticus]|uniref:mucin-13b isoform X1 n=1 Tax=Oreochromis niloticus TaxID=8128 RepID=UPI000905C722|nr:mucin-13 isoform X1 [Oreochromis niloticus]